LAIRTLLPLFKAVLVLFDRKIPNSKAEIIAAVEDLFGLGASVLSDIYNRSNSSKTAVIDRYHKVTAIVESMIDNIDRLHNEQNGRKEHASIQDD
jgi:hypothetical protein